MKKTSDGKNIARSQFAYDRSHNSDHDGINYRIQAARYRNEMDSLLDFVAGKQSHYCYDSEQNTEDKVA